MKKIVIDPMTRIEGHLRIEVLIDEGVVKECNSSGTLFRGFEIILKGRDPLDAQRITQRVCGVCPAAHSIASTLALDSAFGRIVSGVGDKLYSITRKNEEIPISRSTSKKGQKEIYSYMSLAPEVKGRHMEALIVQLDENPDSAMSIHDGEEFIYILDGVVDLVIADDRFDLNPGDSVYYLSTTPHLIASKSGKATILAVLYEG